MKDDIKLKLFYLFSFFLSKRWFYEDNQEPENNQPNCADRTGNIFHEIKAGQNMKSSIDDLNDPNDNSQNMRPSGLKKYESEKNKKMMIMIRLRNIKTCSLICRTGINDILW